MTGPGTLARRDAVAALLADREHLLVVTGLGSPTYDVHAAGDHDGNFYLWGAMGGAALVGLGLAQAQPGRPVLVITGDGEQLMGLGALATIGVARPRNLTLAVLDNQQYGETGMQASHTAAIDLVKVAEACGFAAARAVRSMDEIAAARRSLAEPSAGPRLLVIRISQENPPRSLPSRDAVHVKNRFRAHLGLPQG
ncbi:thiamine pyrophosphate-dependent enzyme [Enterovirga aerilata]|uniref:Aldehyde dehydrogenase n=1 Tax=Enterovirga aerilata TaxID=2730920 RepID=A0A849IAW2_9HYPH|nr:thiamine pyrophosphate-dependent enzyme [Enterovirga sp. DB1703]NNM73549.1 aldehyde dehydrogenase [Enterovirga sp. DB1703]